MKGYYFIRIINEILKKKIESIMIMVLVFFMTLSLSLIHLFGYNDSIENNIGNNLKLSYEMKQNHILSDSMQLNLIKEPYEYILSFINWINEVGSDERVSYYNYDIVMNGVGDYILNGDSIDMWPTVFGINHEKYLEENEFELLEGRFLTQEEIDNGSNLVVIRDNYVIESNGEIISLKVGDKIRLYASENSKKFVDVEVIGIYKEKHVNDYYAINDMFLETQGWLTSSNLVMSLNEKENINICINHIQFNIKEYKNYESFKNELEKKIEEFDLEMKEKNEPVSKLIINQSNTATILESTGRIKGIYNVIFSVVFLIICIVFVISIYYILNKKTQQISIYYSLGESKLRIILSYLFTYLIISVIGIMLGLVVGYFLSIQLTDWMLKDSIQLQADLTRFSTETNIGEIETYIPEFQYTIQSSIFVIIEVVSMIVLTIPTTLMIVLKKNIFTRNGGWNA